MVPDHHPVIGISADLVQSICFFGSVKGLEPIEAELQVLSFVQV